MKLLRSVVLVYFLCSCACVCFSLDRNAFTFTKYDLRIQIEPEQQRLGARGVITLRNDSSVAQRNAALQISSSLDWRSIKINGDPVQFVSQVYTSDLDHTGALSEAIVTLPKEVAPRASVELEIGYEGVVMLDTTRLTRIGVPEEMAKHSDWDQISPVIGAVRGVGYVAWYPMARDAANLSDANSVFEAVARWKGREQGAYMRVNVCVSADANRTVLMENEQNGTTGGSAGSLGEGLSTRCSEQIFDRLGFTVPTLAVGAFSQIQSGKTSFDFLPEHQAAAKIYLQAGRDVAGYIADWFGNGSGRRVKVAELPDPKAAPYESGLLLLAPAAADAKLAEILLVHELTHSVFYSPRAWIYEGVAAFAQALWREQQAGRQAALDYMGVHRTAVAAAEKSSAGEAASASSQSLIATSEEEFYRSKAMFVWWMLRDMIGEPAVKKVITSYVPDRDSQPAYVQKLLQAQTRRDLEWFFDDWVYRDRGLPDFRVVSAYTRQMLRGGYLVTISVENTGNAGAEVPVLVRAEAGETTSRIEVRAKSTAAIRIEVPSRPKEIVVNDGSVPESETSNNTFRIQPNN